jgi:SMC interacting uncharacterized protein involved in chromosome segregation
MDMEIEIKMAKLEHEEAVLHARKLELKKQTLEAKQTLQKLEVESDKIHARISETRNNMTILMQQGE